MFVVSCILSITKMSKKELAEFVSITEDMIDEYLNGSEIPKKIRERFATIFSFPSFYFDVDTENNKYFEHKIKENILKEWENNKPQKYRHLITDDEIIDCLLNGYDLITHKKFDEDHILNNKQVKKFLNKVLKNYNNIENEQTPNKNNDSIYDKLVNWRKLKSKSENIKESMVISDKSLKSIASTTIDNKKELLKIPGIGLATYGKYGDEIYEIIKNEKDVEVLDV